MLYLKHLEIRQARHYIKVLGKVIMMTMTEIQ